MSVRTGNRLRIEDVIEVPEFVFDEQQVGQLLSYFQRIDCDPSSFIERLTRIARDYLWRRKQHDLTLTRSERRSDLQGFVESSIHLSSLLGTLDLQTEWELQCRGWTLEKRESLREDLEELAEFATRARSAISPYGPTPQIPVARSIQSLCVFWKEVMGKAPTHNPKKLTEYVGEALSPAGCFVTAFFAIVDPKIRQTMISTEMARTVKSFRAHKKSESQMAKSA